MSSDRGILSVSISDDGYLYCGVQGGHIQVGYRIENDTIYIKIDAIVYYRFGILKR